MNINTNIEQLSERASELDVIENRKLAKEISDALILALTGSSYKALAASQLNYPYRAIGIKFDNGRKQDIRVYFNPMIESDKGFTLVRQTDPSLPNRQFIHPRSVQIQLAYQNIDGKAFTSEFQGVSATVIQQELDLLDGITLEELGLEIDELFDQATEKERDELLKAYADVLQKKLECIQQEISSDPNLSQVSDAVKFMKSVQSGETKIVQDLKVEVQKNEAPAEN